MERGPLRTLCTGPFTIQKLVWRIHFLGSKELFPIQYIQYGVISNLHLVLKLLLFFIIPIFTYTIISSSMQLPLTLIGLQCRLRHYSPEILFAFEITARAEGLPSGMVEPGGQSLRLYAPGMITDWRWAALASFGLHYSMTVHCSTNWFIGSSWENRKSLIHWEVLWPRLSGISIMYSLKR